jgi:host factor-I protein
MKQGRLRLATGEGSRAPQQEPQQQPKRKPAMSNDKPQNLQDQFLNHIRKQKTPVTVFLVNGVKLQGIVTWFDNFCVLLRRDQHSQLVYKHAISTVMPATPVQLFDPEAEHATAAAS